MRLRMKPRPNFRTWRRPTVRIPPSSCSRSKFCRATSTLRAPSLRMGSTGTVYWCLSPKSINIWEIRFRQGRGLMGNSQKLKICFPRKGTGASKMSLKYIQVRSSSSQMTHPNHLRTQTHLTSSISWITLKYLIKRWRMPLPPVLFLEHWIWISWTKKDSINLNSARVPTL